MAIPNFGCHRALTSYCYIQVSAPIIRLSLPSIEEIGNTIAYSSGGKNIRLKDIAKVYYGYDDEKYMARLNGHRCVYVVAAQKDGENITNTQKAYKPIISKFRKSLPQNIDLVQNFDQADNVNKRLAGLGKDFLIAILLVAVTLLPLGRRPAIIVMISIPGMVTISYTKTNTCGSVSATAPVTVNLAASAGSITGTPTVCSGSTTALADAAMGGVWSSGSTVVATVGSSSGIVAGVSAGTARISYVVMNSCGTATATLVVSVTGLSAGTISGASTVMVGFNITMSDSSPGGTWSSSDMATATVGTSGIVTGINPGIVTISYTVTNSCGSVSATKTVTVNASTTAPITGVASVCVGSTTMLNDATPGGTWHSANTTVATVGTSGVVTGNGAGTAAISYTVGGVPSMIVVTVNPAPSSIGGATAVCNGSTVTMSDFTAGGLWSSSAGVSVTNGTTTTTVTGLSNGANIVSYSLSTGCYKTYSIMVNAVPGPVNGTLSICVGGISHLSDATGGGVSWTSSAMLVATINLSGNVTGISPGTTTVAYMITTGCKATATVTVHTCPATPGHRGTTVSGAITVTVDSAVDLNDGVVSGIWSSSNTNVAVVNGLGSVTGIAPGFTNITHLITEGGSTICSNVTPVLVSSAPGEITIVPNPNKGTFSIRGRLTTIQDEEVTFEVTDMLGQTVYKNKIKVTHGVVDEQILLNNNLPNGTYILNMKGENENKVFHFVMDK